MKRILIVLWLSGASAALAMTTPVQDLPAACSYNSGVACAMTYDSTSGVCRTIRFSTSAGEIQLLVCDKVDHYELYRQSYPGGITFKACTGGGSVDQISGFSSFTSTSLGPGCSATATSLVDPSSAGFAGDTRAGNHAHLLDRWWNDTRLVQPFTCSYGTCVWVPLYSRSDVCDVQYLKSLDNCGGSGSATLDQNCMVSDEFSQVFLVTAQGTNGARVEQLFNTLRLIASGGNGGLFGSLPAWRGRRTLNSVSLDSSGTNRDSASDADARILLGLYIAASSPYFSDSDRTAWRSYAATMAADFLARDFVHQCRTGRNSGQICVWLAAGGNAANGGFASNNFSYAGYHGDAVMALLAAYKALNQSQYLDAARDTVNAYLLAANFSTSFRVPPKAFKWDVSVTPQSAVCTDTCNGAWDDSDAPRATSLCKSKYYASLLGVTLPADLDSYCTAWRNRGGLTPATYAIQYAWDGTPQSALLDGPYENGLGASLDFAYSPGDLVTRFDRVGTKWNQGGDVWYGEQCIGIYRNSFFPTNLGSAIGRDMNPFR